VSEPRKARRALGMGLDALLGPRGVTPRRGPAPADDAPAAPGWTSCPIERIEPRGDQPRRRIDPEALDGLAATIRAEGVLQPLVVRRAAPGADRYEIIAGERRWRAAQKAGLKEVPVVVKEATAAKAFELALIENLQREDLNALEVAEAYDRLLAEHDYTQEELAARVGKSRVAVTNTLRLLKLPAEVRALVRDGALSEGHGRALLGAADMRSMIAAAEKAARARLSVRQVEALVRSSARRPAAPVVESPEPARPESGGGRKSPGVRDLEARLSRRLGTRTEVEHAGPGGRVVAHYGSLDDLDRILERLGV
jgi:ParB family chromosome partitioning protein